MSRNLFLHMCGTVRGSEDGAGLIFQAGSRDEYRKFFEHVRMCVRSYYYSSQIKKKLVKISLYTKLKLKLQRLKQE